MVQNEFKKIYHVEIKIIYLFQYLAYMLEIVDSNFQKSDKILKQIQFSCIHGYK